MEKVYLLLRNNQQTGPHSLEELLQLELKPKDLVWVEGKSYGWSFPTEIDTLKPYVKGAGPSSIPQSPIIETTEPGRQEVSRQSSPKKIYVSMPGGTVPGQSQIDTQDPIEQKAEELRKRIQSYAPQKDEGKQEVRTNYARKLEDVEEDYTSWVFQKKRKKKILAGISPLALGITLVIGLTGAWWLLKPSGPKPDQPPVASTATRIEQPKEEQLPKDEILTTSAVNPVINAASPTEVPGMKTSVAAKKVHSKNDLPSKGSITATVHETVKPAEQIHEQINQNTAVVPPAEDKTDAATTQQQPKEKRTIRGLLNVLFKKNKKEQAEEDARAANTSSNGRSASRRDDEQGATTIDLSDQVQVRSNQSPADWMMGVQGLKLTLYNKSSAQLKNATVEVSYYSEQNDLLQKKTLQFSNIAPQKSQTLPAADHRLADHVEYNVISASGESSAYAKQ